MPDIFDQIASSSTQKDIFDKLYPDTVQENNVPIPPVVPYEHKPDMPVSDMETPGGEYQIPEDYQGEKPVSPPISRKVSDMSVSGGESPMLKDSEVSGGFVSGLKEVGLSATTEPMKDFLNTAIAASETRQKGKYTFIDPNEETAFKQAVQSEQRRLGRDLSDSETDELRQMYQSVPPEAAQKQLKGWGDLLKKSKAALPELPDRERGKFLQAMMGMARFAPAMVATAVSGGSGAVVTLSQIYGSKYGEYRDNGIEPDEADAAAFATAIMSTPVEFTGNLFQLKLLKPLAKSFGLSAKSSSKAIEFLTHARASTMGNLAAAGGRVAAGGVTEGMEEGIQAYAEAAGDILAGNPDDDVQDLLTKFTARISTPEFKAQRDKAIELGLIGGTVLGGIGQSAAMLADVRSKPEPDSVEQELEAIETETTQPEEQPVDIFDKIAGEDRGKRVAPIRTTPAIDTAEIDEKANEAATSEQNNLPEPTEPQQQAGNYKKGHVNINGLDISIENPAGSVRKGKSPDGTEWETEMKNHYGYFKKTKGPDKDHVDVFLGPDAAAEDAQSFIVDQIDPKTGKYDEPKVMMGFKSKGEAQEAYLSNYEDGWQGIGAISEGQSPEALKSWLFDGDTTKPFGYQESAVKIPDFKDTNQAVVFGEKATPEQVKELERLHKDTQKREAEFKAAKDFSDDRSDNAFRGQLYREALEASRGEHAVQRDKRTPQQMLEDGKKRGKIKPPWEMTEDEYKSESPTGKQKAVGTYWNGRQWKPIIDSSEITRKGKNKGQFKVTLPDGKNKIVGPDSVRLNSKIIETLKNETGSSELFNDIVNVFAKDQTQTPRFKKWFGDSKVVDDDGNPLVVYHGTGSEFESFNVPNAEKFSPSHPGSAQLGTFFSTADVANIFARDRIIPAYLRIENPLEITAAEFQEMQFGETEKEDRINELIRNLSNELNNEVFLWDDSPHQTDPETGQPINIDSDSLSELGQEYYVELYNIMNEDWRDANWGATSDDWAEFKKMAIDDGHDGIYIDSSFGHEAGVAIEHMGDTWIVFEPTQIKSAIGNTGKFDPRDPSIIGESQLIADIATKGAELYQSGAKTFGRFRREMRKAFKNVWDKIKKHIRNIWDLINNQRGEITIKEAADEELVKGKEPETTTKAKTEAFEPSKVTKRKQPPVPSKRSTIKYIPPTQRHSQIIKDMSKVFDVPIRVGKYRVGKRAGIYKQREKVIRVASANDIQAVIHENGHHIQDILGWTKKHRFPKEIQNMAYAGATDLNREGFAEFVRYYVTDEAYARKHAPTFYKEFEDHLAGRPEFQNVIIKARQAYNEFKAAPSVAKVASFIVNGDDVKGKSKFPTMGEIYTELKDSLHPIRKVVEIAKKQNGNMRIKDDPYIVARLLRGWARKAQQWVSHSPFQYDEKAKHGVKWVGKGLIDILTPIERAGKMRLFNAYLFAKRAIHDERIIRGFDRVLTIEDFKQTVKELESEFKETAKELYEYNDQLLTYLTNSGRISEESAKAIRANNLFYTPLYRLIEQSETVGNLGQKANNVFNPIKRLKGSSRDILSPTENILRNTYAMINAAERNMLGNALAKLSTVEGMGKYIEKIPFPQRPVKLNKADFLTLLNRYGEVNRVEQIERSEKEFTKSMAGLKKKTPSGKMENVARETLQSRGWTEAESDQIISRIKGAKSDEVRDDIIEKTIEKTTIMIIKEELGFANMPDQVIATFRPQYKAGNNEAIFYQDGKPVLYELDPDIYKAISSVSANEINLLIKFMSFPAKWLRAGATTFSPEFGIRNPMRDQMTAWIQSEYGFVPGVDFMRGALHMMKADESWQLFNVSGAAHSSIVSMDREYLSKNMKQLFRRKKFKGLTLNPLAMMQGFSELTEEASRVSEFTRALKKEGSGLDALFTSGLAGREISLDFSRVGGSGAKAANMISAFWNARLEGLDKMARTFKKHPIKASSKAILGITLPSILLWYAQKDDPVYQELPSWRKTLFWNWVFHRDGAKPFVLSIPKPFEYGLIFGSLPVATLDWSYRNDPTMFQEVGESIMKTFDLLPIPTLGVIGYEWFSEKSWFFDRPVVPRDKEDLEPVLQYTGRTPESVKLLAEVMDKVPIIREVASPAKIENLIQGFTASGGRTALQALDYMLEKLNITDVPPEPSMTLSDMPGIRAIFSEFPKSHSQSIERFYKEYRKKKRKFESNKERMGVRGSGLKGTGFSSIFPNEEAVAKQLSLYRKLAKATYKSRAITPERKRFLLDLYYISMANEARKYFGLKPIINNAKK